MNLTDFNTDFNVKVVRFDDTTPTSVLVHFQVRCIPNNRLSIHTTSVDATQLSEGYTDNDVLSAAWLNVKTAVNSWASFNIIEDPLSVFSVTSTSNAIDLTTFNTHFSVKIVRFELIPNINPTYWCLQYQVSRVNNQSIVTVFESLLSLTSQYCNNTLCTDITAAGWEIIEDSICSWALANLPVDTVVDTVFTPTSI
jgi:hypothetical protein